MAKAPLELSRKPVLALEGGCVIDAAVCMKKVRKITDASKLAPMTFLTFFSLLRKPGRRCRPDCRSGTTCVWERRFFCGKNERESTPQRNGAPRRRNRTSWRQADGAASASAKRIEKERVNHRGGLARSRDFTLLFRIACRNKPTKRLVFGRVLGKRNPPLPFGR